MPDMELQDLMFALLSFYLTLAQFLGFMPSFFPFRMGMFILYHYILEACNLYPFNFYRGSQVRACFESPRNFGLRRLNNIGIVMTMGTLGNGLNIFCILKWPWFF
jgi:hypothetical protein